MLERDKIKAHQGPNILIGHAWQAWGPPAVSYISSFSCKVLPTLPSSLLNPIPFQMTDLSPECAGTVRAIAGPCSFGFSED